MNELKLCFVWIKHFRNFKNAGINFSSSFKFSYDIESNNIVRKKISKLPSSFFGKKITDVTGLIGKNGSGKSNAVELVCKVLKGGNTNLSEEFLIITEENGSFICHHNFTNYKPQSNFDIKIVEYKGKIDPLKIVFFSNVYDQRPNNFNREIADISNNKRYSRRIYYNHRVTIKSDFEKQLEFINSELFDELNIDTPERILITNNIWNKLSKTRQRQQFYGQFREELDNFNQEFRRRLRGIKPKTRFYYLVVFALFQETLSNISFTKLREDSSVEFYVEEFIKETKLYKNESTESMIKDILNWMQYIWDRLDRYVDSSSQRKETDRFREQLRMLENLRYVLDDLELEFETEGKRSKTTELFSFKFNKRKNNALLKYLALVEKNSFFDINWQGISSGHKAYLNLFSLIFSELRRIKTPNVLLCIDEGDLYLHPQWQLEFFSKLLTVLPGIYDGNIQLILTSHSPFLLSDIPKQCLTILDVSQKGCTINGIDLSRETFAGNIYDLYEEPFFLGNQRKSRFSTEKIKKIINSIDNNKNVVSGININKLIELIGDDVIRFHLNKRLKND